MGSFLVSSSVAFFFTFIKYLIIMFVIRFAIVDSYNLFSNLINGKYCTENCTGNFWSYASLIYKSNREDLIVVTEILSFVSIVFMIIYFLVYRRFQYTMYDSIDKTNQTQDDYSIFVEYIPILNFPEKSITSECHFKYDEDLEMLFSR